MARIHPKGQITLPRAVRDEAGFAIGDDVTIRSAGAGRIEIVKTSALVASRAGKLDEVVYPNDYLETTDL